MPAQSVILSRPAHKYFQCPKRNNAARQKNQPQKLCALRENQKRTEKEFKELLQIGVALSSERDVDALLSLILSKARDITNADAGSLYLIEESESGEKHLRFKLTQNDSIQFLVKETHHPAGRNFHGRARGLARRRD